MRRNHRSALRRDADGVSGQPDAPRATTEVDSEPVQTVCSTVRPPELEREIERLRAESEEALAAVEEIYGETRPDMLLLPDRDA